MSNVTDLHTRAPYAPPEAPLAVTVAPEPQVIRVTIQPPPAASMWAGLILQIALGGFAGWACREPLPKCNPKGH